MNNEIKSSLRTGSSMGIVLIFIILIGFSMVISPMLGEFIFPNMENEEVQMVRGSIVFFMALGILNGANGSKLDSPETSEDKWSLALTKGALAGLVTGLMVGAVLLIFGLLSQNEISIRDYLAHASPDQIALLSKGYGPWASAGTTVLNFVWQGLLGALISRGIGRAAWWKNITSNIGGFFKGLGETSWWTSFKESRWSKIVGFGLLGIALLLLPQVAGQYWNYTLGTIGLYVLMGLGLNMITGMAGLLVLGYAAFFAVGAYTVGLFTAPEPLGWMINFWVALVVGVGLAALVGFLLGLPVLRLRGDYLAIVTLGFGEIVRILAKSDDFAHITGGPQGVRDIAGPTLFGQPLNSDMAFLYLIIISIMIVIFITNRLQNSRLGRAWVAMREDETVAQAMGIDTLKYKLLAFALGAAVAGLAGVLFASRNQYTGPEDHTLLVSINVVSILVVGGMNSIPGIVLGAFTLKGLPEMLRQLDDYRILAFGLLLVVMMIWRQEGLWPAKRKRIALPPEETGGHPPEGVAEIPDEGGAG